MTLRRSGGQRICVWLTRRYTPPAAGFGDHDAFPDLTDKAAVLGWHLVNNHPLPDGNKRTAFVAIESPWV